MLLPSVPVSRELTYTQLYYPEGLEATDLLPRLAKRGVVVAAGLHTSIKGSCYSPLAPPIPMASLHETHYRQVFPHRVSRRLVTCSPFCNSLLSVMTFVSFRHMGTTAVDPTRGDIDTIVKSLKEALAEARSQQV